MGVSQKGCKYRKYFYKILEILSHILEEDAHFELVSPNLDAVDDQVDSAFDFRNLAGATLDLRIDGIAAHRIEGKEEIALHVSGFPNHRCFESTIAMQAIITLGIDVHTVESVEICADGMYDLVSLPPESHGVGYFILFFCAGREHCHESKCDCENAE